MYPGPDPDEALPTHEEVEVGLFDVGLGERFPVWTAWDLIRLLLVLLGTMIFFGLLGMMVSSSLPTFRALSPKQLATDARLIVPTQFAAYLVTFIFLYRLLARHYGLPFGDAIHWHWPRRTWLAYLGGGVALALGIQVLSQHLPIPKQMPIDEFFRNRVGAWMLVVFGTLIAPVFEELVFRAMLFPTLVQKSNMMAGIVTTSICFALIHASQLGRAWAPVLVLFTVGLALTLIRAYTRSVAAAVLVHIGYNATLFGMLVVATSGFQHMENVLR